MPPLPRGTCPACGAEVALRKGGLVREHRELVERLMASVDRRKAQVCSGSGQPPVAARKRGAS